MADLLDTLLPALIGMIGIVTGALITSWLSTNANQSEKQREIMREISSSSTVCLGRLLKIEMARETNAETIINDEMWHLGSDSDRYLNAISKTPDLAESEIQIYQRLARLLVGEVKMNEIDNHIGNLINDLRNQVFHIG